jgi:hypothetical protein
MSTPQTNKLWMPNKPPTPPVPNTEPIVATVKEKK